MEILYNTKVADLVLPVLKLLLIKVSAVISILDRKKPAVFVVQTPWVYFAIIR